LSRNLWVRGLYHRRNQGYVHVVFAHGKARKPGEMRGLVRSGLRADGVGAPWNRCFPCETASFSLFAESHQGFREIGMVSAISF
jgi:hypothetical protein